MTISVSLCSEKIGEIKNFLSNFYEKDIQIDDSVKRWMYVYREPLKSVDIISTVMDNSDMFNINVFIQVNGGKFHHVNEKNHNEIIKDMFELFYEDSEAVYFCEKY